MKFYALFLLVLLCVFIYMAQSLDSPPDKRFINSGGDTLKISVQVCIVKKDLRTCRGCKCCRKVPRAVNVPMPHSACAAVVAAKLRRVWIHAVQYCERAQKERLLRRRIHEYCIPRVFWN